MNGWYLRVWFHCEAAGGGGGVMVWGAWLVIQNAELTVTPLPVHGLTCALSRGFNLQCYNTLLTNT